MDGSYGRAEGCCLSDCRSPDGADSGSCRNLQKQNAQSGDSRSSCACRSFRQRSAGCVYLVQRTGGTVVVSDIRISPSAVLSGGLGAFGLPLRVRAFRTQRAVLERGNQPDSRGNAGGNPPESSVFKTAVTNSTFLRNKNFSCFFTTY